MVAVSYTLCGRLPTGVKQASDVVALPGGRFLVVGAESDDVRVVDREGRGYALALPGLPKGRPSELEGVAYDSARHHLLLSREEQRELWRYEWNAAAERARPKLERTFVITHIGGRSNKGIEGLAVLAQRWSPLGRPLLLAVKEGRPRSLLAFDDGGGGRAIRVELDDAVKRACRDFSAVAIDPTSGAVVIASQESSELAELTLERDAPKGAGLLGRWVRSVPLRDEKGKRLPRLEGLTFDEHGELFALTESDGALLHLEAGEPRPARLIS